MSRDAPIELVERVRSRLVLTGAEPTPAAVATALRDEGVVLGDAAMLAVVESLGKELRGSGPLQDLLVLPGVTDILVNGPHQVWIDRGAGLELTDVRFRDDRAVRLLAQRLAATAGRRLDDACPYVDARLRDGTRLHAVISPVATDGTCLSLRVPRAGGLSLVELRSLGMIDAHGWAWLTALMRSRLSFLVSGGTGTGKTTLLSSLLSLADPDHRLVLVEDSTELRPEHPHVVRLEARPPNLEGAGAIVVRDLVRQALRMRPDRLVVGEVRGAEVVDLLAALNTGHEGGCGTVHANSAGDVPARLEALALAAGLHREALHAQLVAGLDVVVHLRRDRDGARRLDSVAEVVAEGATSRSVPAIVWEAGRALPGPAMRSLAARLAVEEVG